MNLLKCKKRLGKENKRSLDAMCSAEIFQGKNFFIFVLSFTTSRHYYVTEIYPSVRKSAKDTMFIETPVPFANLCNFARLLRVCP